MNATEALGAVHADRARDCLHGLALGDAFGETWFRISAGEAEQRQLFREVPAGPWPWTDDTAMALSLYRVLISCGEVRQDDLAGAFAGAYAADPYAIWCAARHLDDLEEALWATASAGGDVDTTCAIAAGIVAARTGTRAIPPTGSRPASRYPPGRAMPMSLAVQLEDGRDHRSAANFGGGGCGYGFTSQVIRGGKRVEP